MEEYISDEIMDFIETKFEDLNDDSKEDIINILEYRLSEIKDSLELK